MSRTKLYIERLFCTISHPSSALTLAVQIILGEGLTLRIVHCVDVDVTLCVRFCIDK